jgi:sulfur carrier protein
MKTFTVNGETRSYEEGMKLASILEKLGYHCATAGIAVALNDLVVPKKLWTQQDILAGDNVEVVVASQGG